MKDCLGQEIKVGDIIAYTHGSYNQIYVVTQLGNNDNVKVGGSYVKASLTIKVTEQCELHYGEKYVTDMVEAVRHEFSTEKPKKAKTAPSEFYIFKLAGKYWVIRAQGFTVSERNKMRQEKMSNIQPPSTGGCYWYSTNDDECLQVFVHRHYYNIYRFEKQGYINTSVQLSKLKEYGLEEYIDKEVPEDVMAALLKSLNKE